jgi:hypothetical protein
MDSDAPIGKGLTERRCEGSMVFARPLPGALSGGVAGFLGRDTPPFHKRFNRYGLPETVAD